MNDLEIQAFDSVEVPVFALAPDKEGRLVYVAFNATAREKARLSLSQVLGKTAIELYPGDFGKIAYGHHCHVLSTQVSEFYELSLPLAGQSRLIRTHLKPLFDQDGQIYRLVGTCQDVTAEQTVREAHAQSVVLDRELEEFVSIAAHDLRSPIRNVHSLATMLREDLPELNEKQSRLLWQLESVAEKAMTLISDVLNYAQATGTTSSIEEFELLPLCDDIMQMLDPTSKHTIEVKNCWIAGDKTATQVVLRNIIDNAIKHNSNRSVRLSVSGSSNTGHYHIVIADNGAGFPDPAIAFLESKKFRPESGYGLLGISKLVKARNGNIVAQNNASGSGAKITLTLPGSLRLDLPSH